MKFQLPVLVLAAAGIALTGCDFIEDVGPNNRYTEDIQKSYPLNSGGRVSVETFNGSVEVIGWDRDSVEVTGQKYAANEDLLKAINVDVTSTPDALRIRVVKPYGRRGNGGAKFTLRVPHKVELERVSSSNGSLRLEDLETNARLVSSNGSLKIYRVKGAIDGETSNGSIELTQVAGGATLRTSNGRIKAEDVSGPFDAHTSNGSIDVRIAESDRVKPLKLDTSNGHVNAVVEKYNQNEIDISSSNSSITLELPPDVNANLKAHTSNSSVNCDFDVTTRGEISKSRLEGTIGQGGPLIDLSSSNGSIKVKKAI